MFSTLINWVIVSLKLDIHTNKSNIVKNLGIGASNIVKSICLCINQMNYVVHKKKKSNELRYDVDFFFFLILLWRGSNNGSVVKQCSSIDFYTIM